MPGVVVGKELDRGPDRIRVDPDLGHDSGSEQVALFGGKAAVDVSFDHLVNPLSEKVTCQLHVTKRSKVDTNRANPYRAMLLTGPLFLTFPQVYTIVPQNTTFAVRTYGNAVFRPLVKTESELRFLTLDALRKVIFGLGVGAMRMTLAKVDGGFVLRTYPVRHVGGHSFCLKTEKTGQQRVFKSVEPAFRLCRELGFQSVEVQL